MNLFLSFLSSFFILFSSFVQGENSCQKSVLVVGGAGYIGSCVNEKLYENGYRTLVLDNLSKGHKEALEHGIFIEGDLGDKDLLHHIFTTYSIDAVMHFAAFLEVGESVKDPLKYYMNNVSATLNLLEAMHNHGVNIFIFSSTAAIFGIPQEDRITETHPCFPMSPYGHSKLMVEQILKDLSHAYGMKYTALRYFNAAGGDSEGKRKLYKTNQSNLIPVILRSLKKKESFITIFGTDFPTKDGTGVRDYIHIEDLATAHISAMERLFKGEPSTCYNLGNGKGFTVREVISAVEKVTGIPVKVIEGAAREGDPATSIADASKAKKELHWEPLHPDLESMIEDTWRSMQ